MKIISLSAVLGIFISLALFWLMQMMISNNQQGFKKTENIQMTEFVRLKRETKVQTKERKIPDEPPPPEKRPPPPKMHMQQAHVTQNNAPQMDMPNLDIPLQTSAFSGSLINGVGIEQSGMSRSPVQVYRPTTLKTLDETDTKKRSCQEQGRPWVYVSYVVSKKGSLRNFKLIDGWPRRKKREYFKIAKQQLRKIKYMPGLSDGVAVDTFYKQILCFKK